MQNSNEIEKISRLQKNVDKALLLLHERLRGLEADLIHRLNPEKFDDYIQLNRIIAELIPFTETTLAPSLAYDAYQQKPQKNTVVVLKDHVKKLTSDLTSHTPNMPTVATTFAEALAHLTLTEDDLDLEIDGTTLTVLLQLPDDFKTPENSQPQKIKFIETTYPLDAQHQQAYNRVVELEKELKEELTTVISADELEKIIPELENDYIKVLLCKKYPYDAKKICTLAAIPSIKCEIINNNDGPLAIYASWLNEDTENKETILLKSFCNLVWTYSQNGTLDEADKGKFREAIQHFNHTWFISLPYKKLLAILEKNNQQEIIKNIYTELMACAKENNLESISSTQDEIGYLQILLMHQQSLQKSDYDLLEKYLLDNALWGNLIYISDELVIELLKKYSPNEKFIETIIFTITNKKQYQTLSKIFELYKDEPDIFALIKNTAQKALYESGHYSNYLALMLTYLDRMPLPEFNEHNEWRSKFLDPLKEEKNLCDRLLQQPSNLPIAKVDFSSAYQQLNKKNIRARAVEIKGDSGELQYTLIRITDEKFHEITWWRKLWNVFINWFKQSEPEINYSDQYIVVDHSNPLMTSASRQEYRVFELNPLTQKIDPNKSYLAKSIPNNDLETHSKEKIKTKTEYRYNLKSIYLKDQIYLLTEDFSGESIIHYLKNWSIYKRLQIANQLLLYVSNLNQFGIVHGDIKAENLHITRKNARNINLRFVNFVNNINNDKEELKKDCLNTLALIKNILIPRVPDYFLNKNYSKLCNMFFEKMLTSRYTSERILHLASNFLAILEEFYLLSNATVKDENKLARLNVELLLYIHGLDILSLGETDALTTIKTNQDFCIALLFLEKYEIFNQDNIKKVFELLTNDKKYNFIYLLNAIETSVQWVDQEEALAYGKSLFIKLLASDDPQLFIAVDIIRKQGSIYKSLAVKLLGENLSSINRELCDLIILLNEKGFLNKKPGKVIDYFNRSYNVYEIPIIKTIMLLGDKSFFDRKLLDKLLSIDFNFNKYLSIKQIINEYEFLKNKQHEPLQDKIWWILSSKPVVNSEQLKTINEIISVFKKVINDKNFSITICENHHKNKIFGCGLSSTYDLILTNKINNKKEIFLLPRSYFHSTLNQVCLNFVKKMQSLENKTTRRRQSSLFFHLLQEFLLANFVWLEWKSNPCNRHNPCPLHVSRSREIFSQLIFTVVEVETKNLNHNSYCAVRAYSKIVTILYSHNLLNSKNLKLFNTLTDDELVNLDIATDAFLVCHTECIDGVDISDDDDYEDKILNLTRPSFLHALKAVIDIMEIKKGTPPYMNIQPTIPLVLSLPNEFDSIINYLVTENFFISHFQHTLTLIDFKLSQDTLLRLMYVYSNIGEELHESFHNNTLNKDKLKELLHTGEVEKFPKKVRKVKSKFKNVGRTTAYLFINVRDTLIPNFLIHKHHRQAPEIEKTVTTSFV